MLGGVRALARVQGGFISKRHGKRICMINGSNERLPSQQRYSFTAQLCACAPLLWTGAVHGYANAVSTMSPLLASATTKQSQKE